MSCKYRNISKTLFYSKEDNIKRDEIINILNLYKEKFFGKSINKKSKKSEFPKLVQNKSFQPRFKSIIESKKKNESKIFSPNESIKYIISPYKDKFYNNNLNKILNNRKIRKKNKSQKNIIDSGINYWNKENRRRSSRQKTVKMRGMKFIDNKLSIIVNYAYSINDFFSNGNFNMDRLKPLNFSDLKRNLKDTNVVYKQLNEEEKKTYILKRKKLREKQISLKNKRIEELQNEGKPFLIIKIKNNSLGQYDLNSILYYSEQEIFMAKKCMLNNWKFPPPEFFNDFFKRTDLLLEEEEKLNNELQLKKEQITLKYEKNPNLKKEQEDIIILNEVPKKKINDFDWTRKDYIYQLLDNQLSQFESTEENIIKDPILKTSGGNWMSFSDFMSLFNAFLVLHNPNALFNGSNLCIDNNWKDFKIDCYEPLDDFMVLKLNNEEIENKDKLYQSFIIFEPNNDKTLSSKNKINNYIILDIVDEDNNTIFQDITMNKFYSTHHVENLKGDMNYYIIIRGGIYQFGYVLQLYSEGHKIENMSYEHYLMTTLGYQFASAKIEHPLINNENFYLLARLRILPAVNEEGNQICEDKLGDINIIFNVKYPIKHLKPFIKIFIQKDEKNNLNGKEIFSNENIYLLEGNYIVNIYFKNLSCPVKENTAEVDIVYSNPNYRIEQIESIEPYIIKDEYEPNRHNIVFKEMIYACDKVFSSFSIELSQKAKEKAEENSQNENSIKNSEVSNIKLNDKIKLILLAYQLGDSEDKSFDIVDKKFAHGLHGIKIHEYEFFNKLVIPNMTFEGGLLPNEGKKGGGLRKSIVPEPVHEQQFHPYLLICYLDDCFDINNSIAVNKLVWNIKVFPSDKLCFIKDMSKEDQEKLLKNDWEEKEPGRAEKAKLSRKRFMLEKIKKHGGKLTEEEQNLIKTERPRKGQKEENEKIVNDKKRKTRVQISALNKKSDEKKIDDENKDDLLNNKKTLPLPKDHCSKYVKSYLKYTYKKRTKKINNIKDQYQKEINNEDIQNEKNKNFELIFDNFNKTTRNEMTKTFYNNQTIDSNKKEEILNTFYRSDWDNRTIETDKLKDLIKNRDTLKIQFKQKIKAENIVKDILKNHSIYNYDFNFMLQSYKDTIKILGEKYPDEEKLYKIICNKKEEELNNLIKKFTNRDRNNVIKALEEVENNKLKISEDTIKKLKELIS